MEGLAFEEKSVIAGIYPDFRSESRLDVIESVRRRRGRIEPETAATREVYDSTLEKLERLTDDEFDRLDLFAGLADAATLDGLFKAVQLLRCPHCGKMLFLELLYSKYYHVSEDGAYLIRDFSRQKENRWQKFLMCKGCLREYSFRWDHLGRITGLEEQKQWT